MTMRRAGNLLRGLVTAIGALVAIVMGTPMVYWWTDGLRGEWSDGRGETLVVLAAELLTEETAAGPATLGEGTYLRCVYGGWAWREHRYGRVIVSGNLGAAAAMAQYMQAQGVPRESIQLEPRAGSTRENALLVAEMLAGRGGPVVLLTSDYHMRRASSAFVHAGVSVKPLPFPDIGKRSNGSRFWRWEALRMLADETGRLVYYRIRGWA